MNGIVISPVSPFRHDNGYSLAVRSDIRALRRLGVSVHVCYFDASQASRQDSTPDETSVTSEAVPIPRTNRPFRYAQGLYRRLPGAIVNYYGKLVESRIKAALASRPWDIVFVEDVPLSGYVRLAREVKPNAMVVLRSHNVMATSAPSISTQQASPLLRYLLRREEINWRTLEEMGVAAAHRVLAITTQDCHEYSSIFGRSDVMPLSIAIPQRYFSIPPGDGDTRCLVHIGTVDMRRLADLQRFLSDTFPTWRAIWPELRFLNFGRVTFGDLRPASGVEQHGSPDDDVEAFTAGRAFLNPQRVRGGLKLKSVLALAAGRVLVSTAVGVEGIDVSNRVHYLDFDSLAPEVLIDTLRDEVATSRLSQAGRQHVASNFTLERTLEQLRRCLHQ